MPAFPRATGCALIAALLTACHPPDRVEVMHSREAFRNESPPPDGVTDKNRFAANMAQVIFAWKAPEGWRATAATEFRHINFVFGPAGEGECYLSIIDGENADLLDNFNRWRGQMGQPKMNDAEIAQFVAQLPQKSVFGRTAPTLDLTGTYTPAGGPMMKAAAPQPDWRMVGSIFASPSGGGSLATIKMTGPKDLVEKNLAAYDAFLASITLDPLLARSLPQ